MFRKISPISYPFIYSRLMSSHLKDTGDIRYLAAYGTLRDDDNSGAIWAQGFTKVRRALKVFSFVDLLFSRILVVL